MRIFDRVNTDSTNIDAPVFEGYGSDINGDIIALQESWDDQLAIMESFYNIEANALSFQSEVATLEASNASEYELEQAYENYQAVTEALVKDAATKIKEFFQKLWGKIKAFFASVARNFDAIIKNGADFAKKYEGQLKKVNLTGFKYKMFDYSLDAVDFSPVDKDDHKGLADQAVLLATLIKSDKDIEDAKQMVKTERENKEDNLDKERGKFLKTGSLTSEEFGKELYAKLRGGATSKEDRHEIAVNIGSIIDTLKDTKEKKRMLEVEKKTSEKFSKAIKAVDAVQTKISSAKAKDGSVSFKHGDNEHAIKADGSAIALDVLRLYASQFSASNDIAMTAFRHWKDAHSERASVYKQVCMAAFRHKDEK